MVETVDGFSYYNGSQDELLSRLKSNFGEEWKVVSPTYKGIDVSAVDSWDYTYYGEGSNEVRAHDENGNLIWTAANSSYPIKQIDTNDNYVFTCHADYVEGNRSEIQIIDKRTGTVVENFIHSFGDAFQHRGVAATSDGGFIATYYDSGADTTTIRKYDDTFSLQYESSSVSGALNKIFVMNGIAYASTSQSKTSGTTYKFNVSDGTSAGSFAVTGRLDDVSTNGDPTTTNYLYYSNDGNTAFASSDGEALKYDDTGTQIWSRATPDDSSGNTYYHRHIKADEQGNAYQVAVGSGSSAPRLTVLADGSSPTVRNDFASASPPTTDPSTADNNPFEQVTATQTSAGGSMNTTSVTEFITSTQTQTIATSNTASITAVSTAAGQFTAQANTLRGFSTPVTSQQAAATATMNVVPEPKEILTAGQATATAGMNAASVTAYSAGADGVSSTATMNTLPPVDESISGTQTAAVATVNTIPPLDESLASTQFQTTVSTDTGAFVSNFLRVRPLSVSATPNDGSVGDYTRTVQQQPAVTATMNESPLNRDTTGLGGSYWKIEQGDLEEILVDGVSTENGFPDFTVGSEVQIDVVLSRDGHTTDYETLREYGEFLSDVSHSVGTDYQQRPYYGERIHPDATFNSTLWLLEPGPGISEAEPWWVVIRGVDDNINIGGTGGTMTLTAFVIAPGSEAPRGIIENRYEVQG